jgi:hypothetical protein
MGRRSPDWLKFKDVIEVISDEMREVVETVWPELVDKLPPKQ